MKFQTYLFFQRYTVSFWGHLSTFTKFSKRPGDIQLVVFPISLSAMDDQELSFDLIAYVDLTHNLKNYDILLLNVLQNQINHMVDDYKEISISFQVEALAIVLNVFE